MASRTLSIDLQSDLLTAVLLEDNSSNNIIASTAIITAEKTANELVAELTNTLDCSDCLCFLSLGASFYSFRNLELPFADRKSINKVLPFELEESSIESMDTMVIDSMVNVQEENDSEIIVAMIQRDILAKYHTALKDAGIPPKLITLSGLATVAEIQANGVSPDEFIFLDLRLDNATLFLFSSGRLQLIRTLPFSPLPFESRPKAQFTIAPENGTLQIHALEHSAESFNQLALTVKQTLAPFPLTQALQELPIYIDGTAGSTKKVSSWLEAPVAFNKPCFTCGRSGLLPLPIALPEATIPHAAFLTACISLGKQRSALKGKVFNFCKGEFKSHGDLSGYRTKGKPVGIVLLVILLLGLGYLWYDTGAMKREKAALLADTIKIFKMALPKVTRIVNPVQQLQVAVNEIKLSSDEGGKSGLPYTTLHILREISQRIPQNMDVRLTRLVYESKGLRLIGITDSFNTVNSMQKNLQRSQEFATVTISSTKQTPKSNAIRFELKIDLGVETP